MKVLYSHKNTKVQEYWFYTLNVQNPLHTNWTMIFEDEGLIYIFFLRFLGNSNVHEV